MRTRFSAEVGVADGTAIVSLGGELDDAVAAEARAAIDQALGERPAKLVIDVGALRFMDSAGIWLIVETHRRCLQGGVELQLAGGDDSPVGQALALSGVDALVGREADTGAGESDASIALRLYVATGSHAGTAATTSVRALADRLAPRPVELEVIDVFDRPDLARHDRVIATPTLIKLVPEPELRLIGSLSDQDVVLRHLGLVDLVH